jgi:hypothetical protein
MAVTQYCLRSDYGSISQYDGNYNSAGSYNGRLYFTGNGTTLGYIYYNTGTTSWCLSEVLDGDCILFGKSNCTNNVPDLCDDLFFPNFCLTPTPTPTIYCNNFSFEAIFDCDVQLTPTPTPTITTSPTPTMTPSSTSLCGLAGFNFTFSQVSPTPTMTPSPTPSYGPIDRPCNVLGTVSFNTVDDRIICPQTKQFSDCENNQMYYTSDSVGGSINIETDRIYSAYVNGQIRCVTYIGQSINNGIDVISIIDGPFGTYSDSGCNLGCVSSPTPTPTNTPTPTITPTITPTSVTKYLIKDCCTQSIIGVYGSYTQTLLPGTYYFNGLTSVSPSNSLVGCYELLTGVDTGYVQYSSYVSATDQINCSQCLVDNGYVDCSACGPGFSAYTGTTCISLSTAPATAATTPFTAISVSNAVYTMNGSRLYNQGYNSSGGGVYTLLTGTTSTYVWQNTVPRSATKGPFNNCAIWTNLTGATYNPVDYWIGFSQCIDIPESKIYYVGLSSDNDYSFRLNGSLIVKNVSGLDSNFKFWNIYPVIIPIGNNIIEVLGLNQGGVAGIGLEIYNNTYNEILGATLYSDLNVVFSTKNATSDIFDVVLTDPGFVYTTSGSTCPSGYVYDSCTDNCVLFTTCTGGTLNC